jgi:hypothetical protein
MAYYKKFALKPGVTSPSPRHRACPAAEKNRMRRIVAEIDVPFIRQ